MVGKAKIYYVELPDEWRKERKLEWLRENQLKDVRFERITPDKKHNWINQTDNDWDTLLPLIDKNVKAGKGEEAVFKLFSYGFDTKRDDYVFSFNPESLKSKVAFFISEYNKAVVQESYKDKFSIKWSRNLEREAKRKVILEFSEKQIIPSEYRPFNKRLLYWDKRLISETFQWHNLFNSKSGTLYIAFSGISHNKPFQCLATKTPHCGDYLEKTQCLPLHRYGANGGKQDNITIWGLVQFRNHYNNQKITREDIFHYTYAVLHHPAYRVKYALNLKREFPRLPFYADFYQWAKWGKQLMDLHINYETAKPFRLVRKDADDVSTTARPKLKADKQLHIIEIDSHTVLHNVPPMA